MSLGTVERSLLEYLLYRAACDGVVIDRGNATLWIYDTNDIIRDFNDVTPTNNMCKELSNDDEITLVLEWKGQITPSSSYSMGGIDLDIYDKNYGYKVTYLKVRNLNVPLSAGTSYTFIITARIRVPKSILVEVVQ